MGGGWIVSGQHGAVHLDHVAVVVGDVHVPKGAHRNIHRSNQGVRFLAGVASARAQGPLPGPLRRETMDGAAPGGGDHGQVAALVHSEGSGVQGMALTVVETQDIQVVEVRVEHDDDRLVQDIDPTILAVDLTSPGHG